MRKPILIILVLIVLISAYISQTNVLKEKSIFPSEKSFYKKSDFGTDVIRITSDPANDNIYYQEPNYFSPDSSKFLFKSERGDGKRGMYLLDLGSGSMTLLKSFTSHIPTWSKDGKEVYAGERGKIVAITIETLEERVIEVPGQDLLSFLHLNPSGDRLVFIEEGLETHKTLSIINTDGSEYEQLYILDLRTEFFLDHPIWVDDNTILFLTRGEGRNYTGEFGKPFLLTLSGNLTKLPVKCSHYDVHPKGDKILCGTEGHIIDLEGNVLRELPVRGHGVWALDGDTFLMTGDPVPVKEDSPYYGKITIMKFSSEDEIYNLVSHENTYDSSLEVHIQPNAQFSRDGKYIIYESDRGEMQNSDLYLVELPK